MTMSFAFLHTIPFTNWGRKDGASRTEIVTAMRRVVQRVGAEHRSTTASTYQTDDTGRACIQGELMRELGYSYAQRSTHTTARGVYELLDPQRQVPGLYGALLNAQGLNDSQADWGSILRRFEVALAA